MSSTAVVQLQQRDVFERNVTRTLLAGAVAGAIVVKSRISEYGEEGSVGASRPGVAHYVATAGATAGLSVAGLKVAEILSARMTDAATPLLLNAAVSGTIIALFAGLGSLASHVALKADPVEARCDEVLPLLDGEFADQLNKALSLYRQCGRQLASLPRESAREELARTVGKLTKDAIELAAEWAGVESQLHDDAHRDLEKEIAELTESASKARDAVAKKQLELAASSLKEELERLGEMRLKRERVLAKLKSQVALLERARVALIGMRSSHATVRAAEMSAVARKLNALATAQADEARLAHAVATNAEIAAIETLKADAATLAMVSAAKEQATAEPMQAVVPVSASAAPTDVVPVPDKLKS
jgi:hypothetical protein